MLKGTKPLRQEILTHGGEVPILIRAIILEVLNISITKYCFKFPRYNQISQMSVHLVIVET